MKALVLAENLQKKLSFATHAISSRTQLPILSHVLLETREGSLIISATDLEIGIEVTIPANIEEEGATTVPAKLFLELVNNLPQDKVTLTTRDGNLEIVSKNTRAVLQTTAREEFPTLYEEKGVEVFAMNGKAFKEAFGKVVFAASIEATRPALSGILLKKVGEGMAIVATDGYRLSLDVVATSATIPEDKKLLIPAKVIREVFAMGEGEDIHLFISEQSNQVLFAQKEAVLVGRLIEAEFPNYEKILPTDVATKAAFDREAMLKAVKTSAIFARETANVIKLSLLKDKIVVSASTPSLGENTVDVEARLDGEENEIAFNGKYLLDVLNNLSDSELRFEMTGPLNPGIFRSPQNPHFLHLIMPIRTQ